jgi:phosphoribosylformylglycinamidine synthase
VALRELDDTALVEVSDRGTLALSLAEMQAIQAHYRALGRDPTDAELECLAQTWSEHCKHKIFASPIAYVGPDGESRTIPRGLFRTFIRGATEAIGEQRKASGLDDDGAFLVSVFHDNAGVVRFTAADHLVYKVETHNSPSALDPYGGAMTGIVGVNRDSFGTGLGADLLTNVYGYCLGDPAFAGHLPRGLMHPRRIREGVHHGVIDGGNHSGVPLSRGWELFDDRYAGKPLVYCGTVAVMPVTTAGRLTHEKVIAAGDAIVMIGGRVGKDGIHGATFSSRELDESAPVQAVQIGDPIVQRKMFDMLAEARDRGLYSGLTDNGAGGLSSSVGELATHTGGARIDLARAPLKYPGLAPWEILVSEAQERMTVAVPPADLDAFLELAARREVEATVLGEFTSDGRLVVTHGEDVVAQLDLAFLHDGVPLPTLSARWSPPRREAEGEGTWGVAQLRAGAPDLAAAWRDLLGRPGLACAEERVRGYDHEVKGLSVVKPLVGVHGDVPATATVMRVRHGRDEGVVLAEGVHPFYGDVDTHAMAIACVDEAVRRLLCAGARLDRIAALDNFCWPDPIVSAKTPDGEHKLAQLVRCCEGLHHACLGYGVPLISGKDSMKNDAVLDGVKISIPPTLLVSAMGQIDDVRRALDLVPAAGQRIGLIGRTASELGGAEIVRALGGYAYSVPRTDVAECMEAYRAFVFLRDAGLVRSAHVVARGGLAVALGHLALASDLTLDVDLDAAHMDPWVASFSESTGRILFTYEPADAEAVAQGLAGVRWCSMGAWTAPAPGAAAGIRARHGGGAATMEIPTAALRASYRGDRT